MGANAYLSTFEDVDNFILQNNAARVFTTSWGAQEAYTGSSTAGTFHNIFNAMLGQGWTLFAAAGDSGAYEGGVVSIQYPSSDPDIVSAGGTELHLNSDGTYNYETTWNGGGGGCSIFYGQPSYQVGVATGCGNRATPDISMNASGNTAQVLYFDGGTLGATSQLYSVWGTSEVAPELAGIFAVMNAYLLSEGNICGPGGNATCAPIGDPHGSLYAQARAIGGGCCRGDHYDFYDITTGNNDNGHHTGIYSAGVGYDMATGWGSINAFQLANGFNWERIWDFHAPVINWTNPAPSTWYNSDQTISWTVSDPAQGDPAASGVSGFTQGWDGLPGDSFDFGTPGSASDYFYNGSEFPNSTSGYMDLSWAGQGCHTAYVEAWDNIGQGTGAQSPGYFCYDTIPPSDTSIGFSPGSPSNAGTVSINATATDTGCGSTGSCVAYIYYYVNTASNGTDSGSWNYIGYSSGASGSFNWNTAGYTDGTHLIAADPQDYAGNSIGCYPELSKPTPAPVSSLTRRRRSRR